MLLKKQTFIGLILLLTTLFSSVSYAGNSDWGNAQWIWQQEVGPANTWLAFRNTFDLSQVPAAALAKIAVDTKYWLWINGEMVLFEGGLARGAAPNTNYYDPVNIAPYLKQGENTIAILVWYWGNTHKTHEDSGKGGLYVSSDEVPEINTNSSWKMKAHPAYDPKSGGNASPNRVQAFKVRFDGRKAMGDWTENAWYTNGFDDSEWDYPVAKGAANSMPWGKLVARAIPQWNDRGLADYESLYHDFGSEKLNLKLPFINNTDSVIVIQAKLPFNKQVTPYLKVKSEEGKTIVVDTDNPFNLLTSTYITKDGIQEFEGYTWFNGHIIEYQIPAGVEILELKYRWTGVGEMTGTFECSDQYFTRLWWMARNTLYICARDGYMDCPDRERGLWIGDVADQTGAIFYTLDEAGRRLLKKGIDNTIAYRNGDTIQGLAPGFGAYRGKSSELTGQSLQFIDQVVWQYYFNTGDKETLANAYPSILNYLKLWEMQPNGLPQHRKGYANWVDWGEDSDPTPTNVVLYYMALKATKNMALALNEKEDVAWYDNRIASIEANFDKEYWQDTRYGSKDKPVEERVSALAIISGLAKKEHYEILVDSVLLPVQKASPHMEWMAEEAIMLTGQYDKGLLRMKQRYASQVNNTDLTTLYEKFDDKKPGTPNHAWNAPNYVLSRYIAGVKATDVAWATFEVKPNLAHLTSVKQIVPSVKGDITIEISKSEDSYTLDLISPAQTIATVYLPKNDKVIVNGKLVWEKGKFKNAISQIKLQQSGEEFISFEVEPGVWTLESISN
ncbi:alpha-L-rhamnosidase C-terminal domain-containing protein [Mangrovibacterium sp.]|uniref:alpha-L-rhamnosidase-related protein n=1 Tax=Mangrovibacterium sp. TaxID=1961364 RepID=UPI003567F1B9